MRTYEREPIQDRIMRKVTVTPAGCWEWQGAKFYKGYGNIREWKGDKWGNTSTHRAMYEAKYGPVPEGMYLLHTVCDNPPCCNPDHLKPGTQKHNIHEAISKGRQDHSQIAKDQNQPRDPKSGRFISTS